MRPTLSIYLISTNMMAVSAFHNIYRPCNRHAIAAGSLRATTPSFVPQTANMTSTADPATPKPKKKKKKRPTPPPIPTVTAADFPAWSREPRDFFKFEILAESQKSRARVGRMRTPHGIVDTPAFVAVATNGALKGVDFLEADEAGQQLVFCNTYHMMLQPGADVVGNAGGLHEFTKRKGGPFITDSGGFQVFSLAHGSIHDERTSPDKADKNTAELKKSVSKASNSHTGGPNAVKVTESGATFRSYRDGSYIHLTPELTVQAQKQLGADIILPLDELPPHHITKDVLRRSVERSHRWEARSLAEHLKDVRQQAMFGIVHGGLDEELRKESVDFVKGLPFDGYAIGGSLGKGREDLNDMLKWLMPLFDDKEQDKEDDTVNTNKSSNKPRHLLGIADEESIRNAVIQGVDTLDSCYPTKLGRHGTLMTRSEGFVKIKQGKYARSFGEKIDEECFCKTCQQYDRAYLNHLFKANEPIAAMLGTMHNIQYMNDLMKRLRTDIIEGRI